MTNPSPHPSRRGISHASLMRWGLVIAAMLAAAVFALAGPAGCRALRDPRLPYHEPLAVDAKPVLPAR